MHWLFKLSGHQEASDTESNKAGSFLAFDSQVHQVSVGDADSEHQGIDLVPLVAVHILNEDDHSLSLSSSDGKSLSMGGDVSTDGILLTEHGLICGLRVLWGELALDVVIFLWSRRCGIEHVNCGDDLRESFLPSLVHLLGWTRELSVGAGGLVQQDLNPKEEMGLPMLGDGSESPGILGDASSKEVTS